VQKRKARFAEFGRTALWGSPADFGKLIAYETRKIGNSVPSGDVPLTPTRRPLKIQRKNSGSCLRAIGTTTRSLRNWDRSAKNLNFDCRLI
jgi:hypothetical protein